MLKRLPLYFSLTAFIVLALSFNGYAEEAAAVATSNPLIPIASGLAIALAAIGGALAQGLAIYGGLTGISRNPGAGGRITTSLIIGLALIESLVIYAFVIAFLLQAKI